MTYSVDTYKAALIAAHTQLTGLLDEYENPAEALMDLYFEQTLTNPTGSVPVYVRGSEIRFDGGDAIVGRLEMIGKPYFRALEPWVNGIPDGPEPLAHMKRAIDALDGGPGVLTAAHDKRDNRDLCVDKARSLWYNEYIAVRRREPCRRRAKLCPEPRTLRGGLPI